MHVISLLQKINDLEDQKWACILAGAEVKPELEMKMLLIDKKLEKLYAWYAKAYSNGLVTEQIKTQFGPGAKPERRKKRNA